MQNRATLRAAVLGDCAAWTGTRVTFLPILGVFAQKLLNTPLHDRAPRLLAALQIVADALDHLAQPTELHFDAAQLKPSLETVFLSLTGREYRE